MRSLSKSKWMEAVQSYVLYFFFYSVLGWLYEVFLEVVVYRWGFTNRGVLLGPYCPVYGRWRPGVPAGLLPPDG